MFPHIVLQGDGSKSFGGGGGFEAVFVVGKDAVT